MRLMEMCIHIEELTKKINKNSENIKTLKGLMTLDKYKTSATLKGEHDVLFAKTIELIDERDFYMNQLEEFESHVTVKVY